MESILIIEDDEQTVALMLNVLRHFNREILHAGTAPNGLELAREHQPKVIILDMRLPGMNGWELAPILKNDPKLRSIPIIAVSVQIDSNDAEFAINAGCDDYVPKPFNIKALRDTVAYYLGD
jgi:two-component system, cell cycle response regulator DivK